MSAAEVSFWAFKAGLFFAGLALLCGGAWLLLVGVLRAYRSIYGPRR